MSIVLGSRDADPNEVMRLENEVRGVGCLERRNRRSRPGCGEKRAIWACLG